MKKATIYLILLFLVSCGNRTGNQEVAENYDSNQFFVVNYEDILERPSTVMLSDLAYDIEYIRLETNEKCILHAKAEYFFTSEFIFVDNSSHILKFDRNGKFIAQIGKQGRGPGEIGLIRMLSVLEEEEQLVVQTNWARKLYYFSFDGSFLKSVPVNDVHRIVALPHDRLIVFDGCNNGYEDYMFILTNAAGDTTGVVYNHYKWEIKNSGMMLVGYDAFTPFYKYGGVTSFKSMHNDTVYHVINDTIKPEYLINLGRYKLPQEMRIEAQAASQYGFQEFNEKSKDYRFVSSLEASEILFITSQEYSEENQYNLIYHRTGKASNIVVDKFGDPGSITNDLDGGLDFWPRGTVNDSILFVPLLPYQIIGDKNLAEFSVKEALDQEKKRQFLEMVNSLGENDNPVLMIVTLK